MCTTCFQICSIILCSVIKDRSGGGSTDGYGPGILLVLDLFQDVDNAPGTFLMSGKSGEFNGVTKFFKPAQHFLKRFCISASPPGGEDWH